MTPLSEQTPGRRLDRRDAAFFLLLALSAAFLLWRVRYGYANNDESFYLTIPRRLLQGDRLLIDEWHMSQFSGVLLYLPVLLFERLTGGTDGIYLAFRYLYVAVQCLAGAAVYLRFRQTHRQGAALGVLALVLYTPYSMNALSYNSMGVLLMALTGALLATAKEHDRAGFLLAGLCFAGAVLCCPYLVLVYLLYALAALVFHKKKVVLPALGGGAFGYFTLGAAILAAVFFLIGLAGADLSRLPGALRGIFSDPEHEERQLFLFSVLYSIVRYPVYCGHYGFWGAGVCVAGVVLLALIAWLDKRRKEHAAVYFLLGTALALAAEALYFIVVHYLNHMMFALNVLALLCFVLAPPTDTVRRIGFLWWLPSMLYSWAVTIGSNQNVYVIFSAAASALPGSIAVILLTARHIFAAEKKPRRSAAVAVLAALFVLQLGGTAFLRYWNVYWDNDIRYQSETLSAGPQRGIVVEPHRAEEYEAAYRAVQELERRVPDGDGEVLVLTETTWTAMGDYRLAAFSAWLSGVNDATLDRLELYYALNPEKIPEVVWVEEKNAEYAEKFCARFGYAAEATPDGIFLTPRQ